MDPVELTCPSGLKGRLRGMTVREEDLLADQKLAKTGRTLDRIIGACWQETTHPGPYAADVVGPPLRAERLLAGDQTWLLLQIRALSYGEEYEFQATCPKGHSYSTSVDLRELPIQPLPASSLAVLLDGGAFRAKLPRSGAEVGYRLLTAADQGEVVQGLQRGSPASAQAMTALLRRRIVEVMGVPEAGVGEWLRGLPAYDAAWLRREFERVDCGVDTAIRHECLVCGAEWQEELPVGPTFFSLPSTKPGASK